MAKWRETPEDQRAYAMRYDPETGSWTRCWYCDLKKGDVFRSYAFDGTQMHPANGDEVDDENIVGLVTADPVHSTIDFYPEGVPDGIKNPNAGWAVQIVTGLFPQILREVAN